MGPKRWSLLHCDNELAKNVDHIIQIYVLHTYLLTY